MTPENELLKKCSVAEKDSINSSSHVHVYGYISASVMTGKPPSQGSVKKTMKRLMWTKDNTSHYQAVLHRELMSTSIGEQSIEERLENVSNVLHIAAEKAMQTKTIRLQVPRGKLALK